MLVLMLDNSYEDLELYKLLRLILTVYGARDRTDAYLHATRSSRFIQPDFRGPDMRLTPCIKKLQPKNVL